MRGIIFDTRGSRIALSPSPEFSTDCSMHLRIILGGGEEGERVEGKWRGRGEVKEGEKRGSEKNGEREGGVGTVGIRGRGRERLASRLALPPANAPAL